MGILEPIRKFDRIVYLIDYLLGLRRGLTVEEIAEQVDRSERTVRRDLIDLNLINGIRVIKEKGPDRKVRYRIEKRDMRATIRYLIGFTPSDILTLYLVKDLPYDMPYIRIKLVEVFYKIKDMAEKNSYLRKFFNRLSNLFIMPKKLAAKFCDKSRTTFYKGLIDAALYSQVCELSRDIEHKIKIAPLHFFNYRANVHLVYKDLTQNNYQTIDVYKIKQIKMLNENFEYPSDFNVKKFLKKLSHPRTQQANKA